MDNVRTLWLRVIQQGIIDACTPIATSKVQFETIKRQSRAWFNPVSPFFSRVCQFAGCDPRNTEGQARKIISFHDTYADWPPNFKAYLNESYLPNGPGSGESGEQIPFSERGGYGEVRTISQGQPEAA